MMFKRLHKKMQPKRCRPTYAIRKHILRHNKNNYTLINLRKTWSPSRAQTKGPCKAALISISVSSALSYRHQITLRDHGYVHRTACQIKLRPGFRSYPRRDG